MAITSMMNKWGLKYLLQQETQQSSLIDTEYLSLSESESSDTIFVESFNFKVVVPKTNYGRIVHLALYILSHDLVAVVDDSHVLNRTTKERTTAKRP